MIVSKMYYHVNLHEVLNSFSTPNVWFLVHFGCDFVGEKRSVWNPFTKELEEFASSPEPVQDRGYLAAPGHSRLKGNLKHMQYIVENSFPIRTWPTWFPFSTFAARKTYNNHRKSLEKWGKRTQRFFSGLVGHSSELCPEWSFLCSYQASGRRFHVLNPSKQDHGKSYANKSLHTTPSSVRFFAPRRSMTKPKRPKYETVSWATQSCGDSFREYHSGGEST